MIIKEGGIGPLLNLLKEGPSVEAQIAAIIALYNIAIIWERVRLVEKSIKIPVIVQVLEY
jgi:hypothetical protein